MTGEWAEAERAPMEVMGGKWRQNDVSVIVRANG